jgi:uncharacterized protein (TIGR02996 family)
VTDRTAELEALIDDDPYDPRSYAVYADWLQEQGDPRGELIALQIEAEARGDHDAARRHRVRASITRPDLEDALFGPSAQRNATPVQLTWRNGFVRRITLPSITPDKAELLHAALAHPSARFLAELEIGHDLDGLDDLQAPIGVIAWQPRPALRELRLGTSNTTGRASVLEPIGNLEYLWAAVPRLTELRVCGDRVGLGALELPDLQVLELDTHASSAVAATHAIAHAHWPELERLVLRCGRTAAWHTIIRELRFLLARAFVPKLRHLGVIGAGLADALIVDALATFPVLRQLRTLDLSASELTDHGAHQLARHADAYRHLESLDVSRNRLTPDGVRAVAGIGSMVKLDEQREPIADDERDAGLYDY